MDRKTYYGTVSEALEDFRKQGFNLDFNLEENCIVCHEGKFGADEFEIAAMYRYEGNTDPADEASVYAIESKNGLKGVLVTGYDVSANNLSAEILKKLS
jgi:hypothetical protein